jgi:hypothetical protein
MNRGVLLVFFLLFFFQNNFAQTSLKAKIIVQAQNLEGIAIANLTNGINATTEKFGFFTIQAKPEDVLVISGLQIKEASITIKESDFNEKLFIIRLTPKINTLDEVVIKNYFNGFNTKGIKTYTPAERRLNEARSGIGITQLINAISGRTAMLKKELIVEKKELLMLKLEALYENNFFTDVLKIKIEYVQGFKFFAVEDEKLVLSIKTKNKSVSTLLLIELAERYKSIVFSKKE